MMHSSPFNDQVLPPVTDKELIDFVKDPASIGESLPAMQKDKQLTSENLNYKVTYQKYLKEHCREGLYCFQVGL